MTNDKEDARSRGFGVLLRNYRTQARITQQELAEALDVDPTTISRWENGRRNPPQQEDIEYLSEILGVSEWQRDRLLEAAGNPLPLSQKVDRIYSLLSSSAEQGSVVEKPLEDPRDLELGA
jgi:transcriptional regulator with XRE-family HTH domain